MDPFDFDQLWNYANPEQTEQQFRALIPAAQAHPDPEYHPQLLTQIARTFSLRRKFDDAHALLDQIEPILNDTTPVARVRYLLERGRSFNSAGEKSQALPLFIQAWEQAKNVHAEFYAVDAAHMAAIAETGEAVMEWNMKAIAIAEQSSEPRVNSWLGSLYNNTGWDYHDKGNFTRALDLFQRALAFRKTQGDPEKIRIARWCIGRCMRSLGQNEEALSIQREVLEESKAAGAPDGFAHEELGELLLALDRPREAGPHFVAAFEVLSQDGWLLDNEPRRIARIRELAQNLS